MFNNIFFRKSCRLRDTVEKYGGAKGSINDVTIWRIRVACWISKATCTLAHVYANAAGHTHKYVIFIAFPRQQWLRERALVLRYTNIACLVYALNYAGIRSGDRSEDEKEGVLVSQY
jgi:hypothetical protein